MRRARWRAEAGRVSGPARIVLTVEFARAVEPVEGLVRRAAQPPQAFSGWSELFAVLMRLTSEESSAGDSPADRAGP